MAELPVTFDTSKQPIFEAVAKNDIHLLKTLLIDKEDVDILDENSMTPLQHAAYKGSKEIVQMLLDQGADVNLCQHQHGYSALHFAGLSGNSEVCTLLLMAGAKSHVLNSVGRTPSQMAAFVGNHNCVSVINNFIPKSQIEYYSELQGQQVNPILPPFLVDSFHKFVMLVNINPVRVTLNLLKYPGLTDHLNEIDAVIELMCTKEIKDSNEPNEVMAFKFHYLNCVVVELIKLTKIQTNQKKEKAEIFEAFCKKLLKPNNKTGNLDYMESFLRECVRSFPFHECTILRQMVASLTSNDPPSALSIVNSAINGQRGFVDSIPICATCGEEKPSKKCSKCKTVQYCDRECQRLHWFVHKKLCIPSDNVKSSNESAKPDSAKITADMQNLFVN